MGFIDVDEFIVPVNRKNIIEVIDDIFYRYENCGGIGINWRVYGSSYNEKKQMGQQLKIISTEHMIIMI